MEIAFHIHKIEATARQGVYLLCCDDDGQKSWLYLAVYQARAKMLEGIAKFLPLKIKVSDYGLNIFSGEGDCPPIYVSSNIESLNLHRQSSAFDYEVYCMFSKDNNGQEFYHYIQIPYFLIDKFLAKNSEGQDFELTHYGKILCSGWGRPSEEVIVMMKEKYGVDTPILENA